jgi:hypothetical protein
LLSAKEHKLFRRNCGRERKRRVAGLNNPKGDFMKKKTAILLLITGGLMGAQRFVLAFVLAMTCPTRLDTVDTTNVISFCILVLAAVPLGIGWEELSRIRRREKGLPPAEPGPFDWLFTIH